MAAHLCRGSPPPTCSARSGRCSSFKVFDKANSVELVVHSSPLRKSEAVFCCATIPQQGRAACFSFGVWAMATSWEIKKPFAVLDAAIWQYLKNLDDTSFQFKRYPEVEGAYVYYMAHDTYGKIELRKIGDNLSELSSIVPSNRGEIPKRYSAIIKELGRRLGEDELFTRRTIAKTRITEQIKGVLPPSQEQNRRPSHSPVNTSTFNSGARLPPFDRFASDAVTVPFKGSADELRDYILRHFDRRLFSSVCLLALDIDPYKFRLVRRVELTAEARKRIGIPEDVEHAFGEGLTEGTIESVRVTDRQSELVGVPLTDDARQFINALASKIEADGLKPAASGDGPQITVKENYGPIINAGHDANIGGDVVGRDRGTAVSNNTEVNIADN